MTPNDPAQAPFPLIFKYRGKATRGQFWIGVLMLAATLVFALLLFAPYFSTTGANDPFAKILVFALLAVAIWLHSAFFIARLRDRGRPVWWYLLYGIAPFALYHLGSIFQGNISNQPTFVSQVLEYAAIGLFVLALIDLGVAPSADATKQQVSD